MLPFRSMILLALLIILFTDQAHAQAHLDTSRISFELSNLNEKVEKLSSELATAKSDNEDSQRIAYASIIISIIVVAISIFQYVVSKQAIKSQVAVGLYNEFREPKWEEARARINEHRKETNFEDVKTYSYLLNHFGFLLEHKYIDADSIYDMMSGSVFVAWYSLSDQILKRRSSVDNVRDFYPFQYHFQYLESELRKIDKKRRNHIERLISKMGSPNRLESEVPQKRNANTLPTGNQDSVSPLTINRDGT